MNVTERYRLPDGSILVVEPTTEAQPPAQPPVAEPEPEPETVEDE